MPSSLLPLGLIMGLILRYATAPSHFENGIVYDCEKLKAGLSTLLINITNQVYEYQYKREINQHNVNAHQGNAMLRKVMWLSWRWVFFSNWLQGRGEENKNLLKCITNKLCYIYLHLTLINYSPTIKAHSSWPNFPCVLLSLFLCNLCLCSSKSGGSYHSHIWGKTHGFNLWRWLQRAVRNISVRIICLHPAHKAVEKEKQETVTVNFGSDTPVR